MADFVSAPQVVDENDIILYGNHYKLGGPIQVVMHTTPPPKIRIFLRCFRCLLSGIFAGVENAFSLSRLFFSLNIGLFPVITIENKLLSFKNLASNK